MINFHHITHDDMLNGDGLRVVLWVAGCNHHCKGCHNKMTWDPDGGIPFTEWEEAEFWEWLSKPWTKGATFSGGDPLHPRNRGKIGEMANLIKDKFKDKDIWLYTGYRLEKENDEFVFKNKEGDTFTLSWLSSIDVLVDGRFEKDTRKADIQNERVPLWRGSSNQRIIDVKETLKNKMIKEREEN